MWYYFRSEPGVWIVACGITSESRVIDRDFHDKEEAARRVNYLNGGAGQSFPNASQVERVRGQLKNFLDLGPGRNVIGPGLDYQDQRNANIGEDDG